MERCFLASQRACSIHGETYCVRRSTSSGLLVMVKVDLRFLVCRPSYLNCLLMILGRDNVKGKVPLLILISMKGYKEICCPRESLKTSF